MSKNVDKENGSDDASSTEAKNSTEERGDVYMTSTGTHVDFDAWLINSNASFHMNPNREWLSEYGKYDGGDVSPGDELTTKIMGCGRVKLLLKDGRIRTLPRVLHILDLARSLIYVSNLDDANVDTLLGKGTCKMVRGVVVLMRGVRCGTLYKLLGSTYIVGCNNYVVLEKRNKEGMICNVPGKKTTSWHQRVGHIGEKGFRTLHDKGTVEGMPNCPWILIYVNIALW